ncbi:hypothetical protein C1645_765926 [Glomus cerebriforme]|uniref:Uncharacterized protein n=1 Tax=Glomus cerebriforme TaxID=658196 RepID=A0A397TB09_9GLOM|nr:hypothetical protein C1645_765926 [Glomus cerebriforme]
MDFEKHIVEFFQSENYAKWSVLGALQYLSDNVNFTSASLNDISDVLRKQLEVLSNHKNVLQAAKNKAIKLRDNLQDTLANRAEIKKFLEIQDLKFAEDRYKVNVELSVVTDKTAMVGKSSEKFAQTLNNINNTDDPIKRDDGENENVEQAISIVSQATVNHVQEENENEDKDDENEKMICVKSILEDSITASDDAKALTDFFFNNFPRTTIMDLRPKSKFSLSLDSDLQKKVLHEIFDHIDNKYITNEIHEYLTTFFNEDHSARGWDDAINNAIISDSDSEMIANTKKLMKETLPKFLKAFSLAALNPLRDITTLEKPHLNQFVHPIIDSALWIFARVNYIYGEIPLKGLKTKIRADGVGFLNDVINYPMVCGEGARPGASSVDDDVKNARSMAELYNHIVISEADARRQLFTDLRTYGITAFKTEVSLSMMDFRSIYRLFEVDHFGLPRDWVDMPNFMWLYEAVIKWALCINETRNGLVEHRKKRRVGRYSEAIYAKKLSRLRD